MNNFDENRINRQASGTSAGGQFANKDHPSNDGVDLKAQAESHKNDEDYNEDYWNSLECFNVWA